MNVVDKREMKKIAESVLASSFKKRIGDTPTDALQLVNKAYVDSISSGYPGHVAFGGSPSTPFPTGWTSVHNSTGSYTVTHNLGTTLYAVEFTAFSQLSFFQITAQGANSFTVGTNNLGGSSADTEFYFTLTPQ